MACFATDFDNGDSAYGRRGNANTSIATAGPLSLCPFVVVKVELQHAIGFLFCTLLAS
jgi:hypothetical protein